MNNGKEYAVQMHGITKRFGSFNALDQMELDVKKGSIHSILGENGAGKSTLMNVLYGLYQPEEGEIFINGEEVRMKSPTVALEHGIGMVHQHFKLVGCFTVTQNIVLGLEPDKGFGVMDMKEARRRVVDITQKYGLDVDPDALVDNISVGMQQRVEILKALYREAEILILDEPTAVLTPQEIDELIHIMHKLADSGKTIIVITHKLKEIKKSAEYCTIIRKGTYVKTVDVSKVTEEELAADMVGHAVKLKVDKEKAVPGDVVFQIDHLTVKNEKGLDAVKDLSLKVRSHEIVGIAGIDGNGQKELVEAIAGLIKSQSGRIVIEGQEVQNTSPKNVIDHKISIIHEDRHKKGLVLSFDVSENAVLETYNSKKFSKKGFLNRAAISEFTRKLIQDYDVRPSDCENSKAVGLSGGNQQKIIIGREIANDPSLLIAVQPTRGLDVGAIEYVHKMLVRERDKGKAILLISLELDEVMSVADTISVIYDGSIVKSFSQGEVDEQTLGLYMAGGSANGTISEDM